MISGIIPARFDGQEYAAQIIDNVIRLYNKETGDFYAEIPEFVLGLLKNS